MAEETPLVFMTIKGTPNLWTELGIFTPPGFGPTLGLGLGGKGGFFLRVEYFCLLSPTGKFSLKMHAREKKKYKKLWVK